MTRSVSDALTGASIPNAEVIKWRYLGDAAAAKLEQTPSALLRDIRNADWQPIPRTYSSGLSLQKINAQARGLMTLEQATGTEQTLPGQEDIYPFSTPAMTRMGDDLLLT